jgi:hypothetical protein
MNQPQLCSNRGHVVVEHPATVRSYPAPPFWQRIGHLWRSQWQSPANRDDARQKASIQERLEQAARLQRLIRHLWR